MRGWRLDGVERGRFGPGEVRRIFLSGGREGSRGARLVLRRPVGVRFGSRSGAGMGGVGCEGSEACRRALGGARKGEGMDGPV